MVAFLSTLSLRRATWAVNIQRPAAKNFYPRSPCGERHRYGRPIDVQLVFLSTLSLRRATQTQSLKIPTHSISIHALLAESDMLAARWVLLTQIFLSTLSLRRATDSRADNIERNKNFYPRSPCGERPMQIVIIVVDTVISIHALLAESDRGEHHANSQQEKFLSTLSLRRATVATVGLNLVGQIFLSTLSLRRATSMHARW